MHGDLLRAAGLHKAGDTAAAVVIWKRWAEQGDVDAAYNLAVIHQHGDGVARDASQALKWYRFAAERGDRWSQLRLGAMYQGGEGVTADPVQAHYWFTKHRREHAHHDHNPQMQEWRRQAAALIRARDMRETAEAARTNSDQVLAELKQRAEPITRQPAAQRLAAGSM
jgi:TPR repeat protein